MRRLVLLATVVSCGLLGFGPATALAHHRRHHHHVRHHRHHVHAHTRRFGDNGQPSQPSSPATSPDAGTVASFTNGVLTITLNDGSSVSGAVTNDTEIECEGMQNDFARDHGPGGGSSGPGGGDDGNGDRGDNGNGDRGDNGNGDRGDNEAGCPMTALTSGAVVREAKLRILDAGAIWSKVELAH
jgi:hypothetical protein